jgi:hypothetical protein
MAVPAQVRGNQRVARFVQHLGHVPIAPAVLAGTVHQTNHRLDVAARQLLPQSGTPSFAVKGHSCRCMISITIRRTVTVRC